MKAYKEFTFGWLIFAILIPVYLLVTYLYVNDIGDKPIETSGYVTMALTFLLICLFAYGMTTTLTADNIIVSFGIGIFKKKIALKRITSVDVVKSPWYYGWGIRIIPNGILYNMSGTDGVELKFNDTKQIIRIGTKDPVMLKKKIEKELTNYPACA